MLSEQLEKTIKRAISYANDRQHQYATLEHFLLALLDDKDAAIVLKACDINFDNLKNNLVRYLNEDLKNIISPHSQKAEPSATHTIHFNLITTLNPQESELLERNLYPYD